MTSQVDICNRALSDCGARSTISSLTDGSIEAVQCSFWYEPSRKSLLRMANWAFARTQILLTQVGVLYPDNTSPYPELYSYVYPPDCLRVRYIIQQPTTISTTSTTYAGGGSWTAGGSQPRRDNPFIIHTAKSSTGVLQKLLLTNIANAIAVYTLDLDDPDFFDDLFEEALVSLLSFRLCIPLTGNFALRQEFARAAKETLMVAQAADGNEAFASTDHTSDWIATRMIGGSAGFNPYSQDVSWGMWSEAFGSSPWGS